MSNILSFFKPIRVLVFDVDGVMTDGSLSLEENGDQVRRMHIRDGYALQLAVRKGYRVMVLSGGRSAGVISRLHYLGVQEVYMGVGDKGTMLSGYLHDHSIDPPSMLYMGDDVPDILPLKLAGLSTCPADAVPEVKAICQYISPFKGGAGCVRDVIEKVLRLNGHWVGDTR